MINRDIAIFLAKVLGMFVLWYVFYEMWLLPDGRLDEFLSVNIVNVTGGILSLLGQEFFLGYRTVGLAFTDGLYIIDGCNGLEAIGLFIGFVVAYPGDNIKRALFIPMGILVIYLANVARIVILAFVQLHYPQGFEFAHDYSTSSIFYIIIFLMFIVWINFGGKPKNVV